MISKITIDFNKKTRSGYSEKGFSAIEAILILVIVCMVVGLGLYVFHSLKNINRNYNSATTNTNSPMFYSKVTSKDGKVSIRIPSAWHVLPGINNSGGGQFISMGDPSHYCHGSTCATTDCLGFEDSNPCLYQADLQPKALNEKTGPVWSLSVEKTTLNVQNAAISLLGGINSSNKVQESTSPINGFDTLYVKVKGGDPSSEYYVDSHYFIEKDGYLLHMVNRDQYINASNSAASYNVSKYDGDFTKIANSIKINL